MQKFRNKYRIPSTRMQNWDYGWNAPYFITICTANRFCYFGEIRDGKMDLSEIGEMAHKFRVEIPEHFPFVKLDEFVIMPNHVHGIIIIDKPDNGQNNVETPNLGVSTSTNETITNETITNQIIADQTSINQHTIIQPTINPPVITQPSTPHTTMDRGIVKWKPGTIGVIINQYKRVCTINVRKIDPGFAWQPRFHDIIIRDNKSLNRFRNYIIDNPENWNE